MPKRSLDDYLRRDASHYRITCVHGSSIDFVVQCKNNIGMSACAVMDCILYLGSFTGTNGYRRNDRYTSKVVWCSRIEEAGSSDSALSFRLPQRFLLLVLSRSIELFKLTDWSVFTERSERTGY
uniref:AlNc14C86G5512 protein n=1 Tax=Albugo laibachii Nc14 TaxID=890382 RepID=F0WFX8_9STRA|nr:AlNc14C86G5512 [Albugo laibachii Nc14]|eukprot:CCA20112.1 AlNc14C86G5512 [Albugo laibachii Nc14]